MANTEDKHSFSKKGRHNLPGHFTGHHVRKLLSQIKGHDEAPSEAEKRHEHVRHVAEASTKLPAHDANPNAVKPSLTEANAFTPGGRKTRDDVTTGEGLSNANSLDFGTIDGIRSWRPNP